MTSTESTPSPNDVHRIPVAIAILALTMLLMPSLGLPIEYLQQDHVKFILLAFGTLAAALAFVKASGTSGTMLRWHAGIWFPIALGFYALASIGWAHPFFASVEAVHWLLFALLLWLGLNISKRSSLPMLAWGIHGGATIASLWTALQFWFDFSFFPQGPNPASTFGNRNVFAEFAVMALPFSALLLAHAHRRLTIFVVAASNALVILAIMMTGTRSALTAMWLFAPLAAWIVWRYRSQLACGSWRPSQCVLALGTLALLVAGLGMVKTGNGRLLETPERGLTPIERAFMRTASISTEDESLGVRFLMWKETGRMIAAHPWAGVGAGSWAVQEPLYQTPGSEVESDYFVHNEFLQVAAEYGVLGWLCVVALLAYLVTAAWRTLHACGEAAMTEGPWRAVALCSLLSLMVVSCFGFPWHMPATGALFMLALSILMASDARMSTEGRLRTVYFACRPGYAKAALGILSVAALLAASATQWLVRGEYRIFKAAQLAQSITASGDYKNPNWDASKKKVFELMREGIAINPYNRLITSIAGDEAARWGDWKNAAWIWAAATRTRPYTVVLLTNIARAYLFSGEPDKAVEYIDRAREVQPNSSLVQALDVIASEKKREDSKGLQLARSAMANGVRDFDFANATFALASRNGDYNLAIQAMAMRLQYWPEEKPERVYLQLGQLYDARIKDSRQAAAYFQRALALCPASEQASMLAEIPPAYRP
jgi:O-antigen ligase/tetratricopeptide (TPR) repeat protein